MTSKQKTIAMGAVVILGAIVFGTTAARSFFVFDQAPASPQAPAAVLSGSAGSAVSSSRPVRLIIPSLAINAGIQYVGVNTTGNMRAPSNFTDVSWYQYGAIPGQKGSAVMAGHVDNGLGLPGVFKNLNTLKVGDDLYVQTKDGSKLHFVISDIENYPYQQVPVDTLFTRNDAAYLNLITCEGTWVAGHDTYDHRLVIYSKLVP